MRPPDAPPEDRPEQISASFDMRVGNHVTLQGRAGISPLGVVCAGIAVAMMTLALGSLLGSLRRRERR